MSNFKLSVLQREVKNTAWHESSQFVNAKIKEIKIFESRNDKSLNAIPSPLARLHLFDAAFSLVYEDELHKTNYSGMAYKKLISDCLDVFELVYNWNYHIHEGKNLAITVWNKETEVNKLKSKFARNLKEIENLPKIDEKEQIPLDKIPGFASYTVGKTLGLFLGQQEFAKFKDYHIIKLGDKPIAGTSPLTGFFTTPNDLSELGLINPLTKKKYFGFSPVLFEERSERIKKFIYDFIRNQVKDGTNTVRLFDNELGISKYLREKKSIVDTTLELKLKPFNPEFSIFDGQLSIEMSEELNDYFEPDLVKLNYRVNADCFATLPGLKADRTYDYLLPFTDSFFRDFKTNDFSKHLKVEEKADNLIVTILSDGKEPLFKVYAKSPLKPLDGKIIDVATDYKLTFSLSLFPFVMVRDRPDLNKYFKVMVASKTTDKGYTNAALSLSFYSASQKLIPPDGANIRYSVQDRSQLADSFLGSRYYEIDGGSFSYIQLKISAPNLKKEIRSVIVPKWPVKSLGQKKFKYAVDFGTTTSFVAYRDSGNEHKPEPLSIEKKDELIVAHFHKPVDIDVSESSQQPYDYEGFDVFNQFNDLEIKEFIPPIIGSGATDSFSFPIRTAVCELNDVTTAFYPLSNANIAFGYEKIPLVDKHQSFKTNLKWAIDGENEKRIKVFLLELVKIIKYRIIKNGGDPENADLIWFYPLSFGSRNLELFESIWEDLFKKEFKTGADKSSGKLIRVSESEAPFYFHKQMAELENFKNVLSVDIGGGSTDIVYFDHGKPDIGSSFNFATNLIWSDGNVRVTNARKNGIFNAFAKKISDSLAENSSQEINTRQQVELKKVELINTSYLDSLKYGSDDIINFWLSNDDKTHFTNLLNRSEYRLNFLFFFSAIIFHSGQLLKAKNSTRPSCICFSGNGSRIVDLITKDKEKLSRICQYLINTAYGFENYEFDLQVVLPVPVERKEATSFGGLYKDPEGPSPKPFTYLGYDPQDEQSFKKVEYYKDINAELEQSVLANIKNFVSVFKKMNSHVNFKGELGLDVSLESTCNFILQNIKKNYDFERDLKNDKMQPEELINDSLFFWALKGILYDLTNISAKGLAPYQNRLTHYFEGVSMDGKFLVQNAQKSQDESSWYKLETDDDNTDQGIITLVTTNDIALALMLSNPNKLMPACNFSRLANSGTTIIRVLSAGKVERVDNVWVIKEKIQIEFL